MSDEVVKITIDEIDVKKGIVTLSIRLRGDVNWHFHENVKVREGWSITFHDNQPANSAPRSIEIGEVPRGHNIDKFIENFT